MAGGGAVTTRTTYRIAGQIVAVRSAGTLYYTYGDHLGNIAALSSTTGVLDTTSLARYDPFGNFRTTPATNPDTTNHGFTGHVHNNTGVYPTQNVGLIYMNARYYLPEVGRFISPDSIVPEPGNAQSYNRYSYSYNNPVKFSDPSGHCGAEVVASNDDPTVGYDEVATCLQLRSELESILGHPVLGIWYLWQMRAMHEGGFALADQGIILKLPYLPNRRYALEQLAVYWAGTNITSLEISARVVEFAAAMGASIEDLIAVLSGHGGDGIGRPGGRTLPSPKGPYSSEDALKDRSSGFNEKYGDPDPSNNQVHHTWYWIQVAYYNADITAYIGNLLHEAGDGAGKSVQDYRAGVWGIQVGTRLQKGQLSLVDLAMKLRVDLGN